MGMRVNGTAGRALLREHRSLLAVIGVMELIAVLVVSTLNLHDHVDGEVYWLGAKVLRSGGDLYDSFKKYQSLLIEEFDKMAEEFKFEVVDARKSPEEIQDELRSKIQQLLLQEGLVQTEPHATTAAQEGSR